MIFKNNEVEFEVNELGAELTRLTLLKNKTEILVNKNDWGRCSPILFPIVGKVDRGYIKHEGKTYRLDRHAFVRTKQFKLKELKNGIEGTYKHKGDDQWPFDFILKIYYLFDNKAINIRFEIKTDDNSLYNLGWHPAFNTKDDINIDAIFEYENHNGYITNMKHNKTGVLKFKDIENDKTYIYDWYNPSFKIDNTTIHIKSNDINICAIWTLNKKQFICVEAWAKNIDQLNNGVTFKTKDYLYGNNKINIYLTWEEN